MQEPMETQLERAARHAALFIDALIQAGAIPDVLFDRTGSDLALDAPLDPTQPWDAQAEDVRDSLRSALAR